MEVRFEIWVRLADGSKFVAFRWTRGAEAGVERAKREAASHGFDVVDAWAVAV